MPGPLEAILHERNRQDKLLAEGKITVDCTDPLVEHGEKLSVLIEEIGEVARAIQNKDSLNLREELTQAAAVSCAWLESLPESGSGTW